MWNMINLTQSIFSLRILHVGLITKKGNRAIERETKHTEKSSYEYKLVHPKNNDTKN